MQPAHIQVTVQAASAAGDARPSPLPKGRDSEKFAFHFEKAGQEARSLADPAPSGTVAAELPQTEQPDALREHGEDAEPAAGDRGETGAEETDAPANDALFTKDRNLDLYGRETTLKPAGAPQDEPLQKADDILQQRRLQSGGTASDRSSGGLYPPPAMANLGNGTALNGSGATGQPAQSEYRPDVSPRPYAAAPLPVANGAQSAERTPADIAGASAANVNAGKTGESDRQYGNSGTDPVQVRQPGDKHNRLTVPVIPAAQAGPAVESAVRPDPVLTPQQGLAKVGDPVGTAAAGQGARQSAPDALPPQIQPNTPVNSRDGVGFAGLTPGPEKPSRLAEHRAYSSASALPVAAAAPIQAKTPVMSPGQMTPLPGGLVNPALQEGPDRFALALDSEASENLLAPVSRSVLQSASVPAAEGSPVRSESARMVAAQLVNALIRAQNNKVEISLNPAELGRVRMVLATSAAGVEVSIAAERPETLELMRRHIDQLAEEFRRLGYDNIGFEFAGGQSRGGFDNEPAGSRQSDRSESGNHPDVSEPGIISPSRTTNTGGIDLRL